MTESQRNLSHVLNDLPASVRLVLGLTVAAAGAYYGVNLALMFFGSRPQFTNVGEAGEAMGLLMAINGLGCLIRRIGWTSVGAALLGVALLVPYLFVLRWTAQALAIQLSFYVGLPLANGGIKLAYARYLEWDALLARNRSVDAGLSRSSAP